MGLFFLVVCAVGILRPIKNALALEGLGATAFYKVYLVSAAVVLFVPLFNRLADRVPWKWLVPGVAIFFALHLVAFRAAFDQRGALLGLVFYGWFDLVSAVLVAQFFITTQRYFNARDAKRAYPLIIAGGAIGASLGGLVTGLYARSLGTGNLLLVAAALITVFGVLLPWVGVGMERPDQLARGVKRRTLAVAGLGTVLADRHVRLIAASVLLTVVVKQLVDYQFNALSLEVYRTREAVSAFQGRFNAATQWLPIVAVMALRPLMARWGVGAAILLLPACMLFATLGMAAWWSLWIAVAAKTADSALRYSAERTGREVLYIPLPDEIKLKAKTYVDVAVENGLGKVLAAGLIWALLAVLHYRQLAYVSAVLSVAWLAVTLAVRREYVRALARSIEGRFASLNGTSASLSDASTRGVLQRVLARGDPLQTAFALDLLEQAEPDDARPFAGALHRLLDSPAEETRLHALAVLARLPDAVEEARVRERLRDPAPSVRQAAVRVLCTARPADREAILGELLASPEGPVRTAALACLALGEISADGARLVRGKYLERPLPAAVDPADPEQRVELALAAGTLHDDLPAAARLLEPLLADPDPRVATTALRSAGLLRQPQLYPCMISALRSSTTREAAREALTRQGTAAVPVLARYLHDTSGDPRVRRSIPSVLARIPVAETVQALLRAYAAPETDQLLDHRTLKALSRLRAHHPELLFDARLVRAALGSEIAAACRYAAARAALDAVGASSTSVELLRRTLGEGWRERREGVFRCLGLIYPPREVYRCYQAVAHGEPSRRANALEWLEQTLGRTLFAQLAPVLHPGDPRAPGVPALRLQELWGDGDAWIARCALWAGAELRLPGIQPEVDRLQHHPDPDLRRLAGHLRARLDGTSPDETPMDLIEKVFLLQQIDLLQEARSNHLALLASIAEELEAEPGAVLIQQGEATDALYVVIRGAIELHAAGGPLVVASEGMSFGSWALIDEAASPMEARATRPSHLLRITRDDFQDLLADHPELASGLLQGLARRVRALVA